MGCRHIYGELLIQPYSYLLLSSLLFSLLKELGFYFWRTYLRQAVLNCIHSLPFPSWNTTTITTVTATIDMEEKKESLLDVNNINQSECSEISSLDIIEQKVIESVTKLQTLSEYEQYFNRFQVIFGIIVFIFICIITPSLQYTSWENYSHICIALVYSPFLTSLVSMSYKLLQENSFKKRVNDEIEEIKRNYLTVGSNIEYNYTIAPDTFNHDIEPGFVWDTPKRSGIITDISPNNTLINVTLNNGIEIANVPWNVIELPQNCTNRFELFLSQKDTTQFLYLSMFLFILSPFYFTHLIPGFFPFIWVWILLLGLGILLLGILDYGFFYIFHYFGFTISNNNDKNDSYFCKEFLFGWMFRFLLLLFIQMTVNYAILLFRSHIGYLEIIIYEFQLRMQTKCYFEQKFDDLLSVILWLSWL